MSSDNDNPLVTIVAFILVCYGIYWVVVNIIIPAVLYSAAVIGGIGLLYGGCISIRNFFLSCRNNISLKQTRVESH